MSKKTVLTRRQRASCSRQIVSLIELVFPVPVLFLFVAVHPVIPHDAAASILILACATDQTLDCEGSRCWTSREFRFRGRRLQLVARRADVELGLLHAHVHDSLNSMDQRPNSSGTDLSPILRAEHSLPFSRPVVAVSRTVQRVAS